MDKYKVAIVDDDEVALENLSFELGKDARFSLKGTARNGKQGEKTHCQGTAGFVVLGCGNAGYDRNGTTAGNTWQCFMEHADCFLYGL